jgi:serine/threonine protein kinase/formylglycine-generating enzyme required for sulfatase activity
VTPDPWDPRLEDLYDRASSLPADQRDAFIERECLGDADLARQLREMLATRPATKFLEPPDLSKVAARLFGTDLSGQTLGSYRLVREIGRGAMGVVYLADDTANHRRVAVKILPTSHQGDAEMLTRFRREALAASKLAHSNIVPILDFGEEAGLLWYAMEYIDGHDLHEEIERLRRHSRAAGGSAPIFPPFGSENYVSVLLERFSPLVDAIHAAHRGGIVHRDIKPQNILLDHSGRMFLADFGLARDARLGTLTAPGQVQGTPHYMSPEQARVLKQRVDHRTDIYSVAVVLYELLCLERAVDGTTQAEVIERIGSRPPRSLRRVLPTIARDLDVVCAKGMAMWPNDRYRTAAEFAEDLRRFNHHEAIVARPPSPARRIRRFASRHSAAFMVTLPAVAALAGGITLGARHAHSQVYAADRDALARLHDASDWRGVGVSELIEARRRALDLKARGDDAPGELAELTEGILARFARYKQEQLDESRELLWRGMAGNPLPSTDAPLVSAASPRELARALEILHDLRAIFSDDPALLELADVRQAFPRVSIALAARTAKEAANAAAAHAFARPIDPVRGEFGTAMELGALPLTEHPIAPGFYRFVVEIPGYGFAELTRELIPRLDTYDLSVTVRRSADATVSMHAIAGGRYALRKDPKNSLGCDPLQDVVDVPAFFIDEAETSNGEYLEFLRDTHHEAPHSWRVLGFKDGWYSPGVGPLGTDRARWLELPATGINQLDAIAYAEWAGKRLPTHFELERADRGASGLFTPDEFEPDPAVSGRFNICGESVVPWTDARDSYERYLRNVLPVREPGYRQLPEGLFHAFGNVAEYTESPVVESHDGVIEPTMQGRLYLGGAWDAGLRPDSLATHPYTGLGESYTSDFIGIRCAKSAAP